VTRFFNCNFDLNPETTRQKNNLSQIEGLLSLYSQAEEQSLEKGSRDYYEQSVS